MVRKPPDIDHYHFDLFRELITLKLSSGVSSPGNAVKLHLGGVLGERGLAKPKDNRPVQWQSFFRKIKEDFFRHLDEDLEKFDIVEKLINSQWTNPASQSRLFESFLIYYWLHLTPSYKAIAQKIDEDVIGASFVTVFGKPLPTDTAEAAELLRQVLAAQGIGEPTAESAPRATPIATTDGDSFSKIAATRITRPTAPFMHPPYVEGIDVEKRLAVDPADGIWLNPHNHHSIKLSGRQKERTHLDAFMARDDPFLICPVIAPSGAGKTRLISEWMTPYVPSVSATDWDAGFVVSRSVEPWKD